MPLKVDANSTLNAYDRLEKIFLSTHLTVGLQLFFLLARILNFKPWSGFAQ